MNFRCRACNNKLDDLQKRSVQADGKPEDLCRLCYIIAIDAGDTDSEDLADRLLLDHDNYYYNGDD